MNRITGAWGLGVVLAACGATETSGNGPTVVDSAGVRIVESHAPASASLDWTLSAQPTTSIGTVEGDEGDILFRVFSARRLGDGSVLVSNSGTSELRVYDPTGSLVRSFGRRGQGPGEFDRFSSMRIVAVTRDSVTISDQGNGRLQVFGLDGGFGRTFTPATVRGFGRPDIRAAFAGGRWLGVMPVGPGTLRGEPGDLIETSFAYFAYDPPADSAVRLTTAPGRVRMVNSLGDGARHFPFVPFTPEPVFAVDGDMLLLNATGAPELLRISLEGGLAAVHRWRAQRIRTADVWARYTDESLAQISESRRPAYARLFANDRLPVPDLVPAVGSILVDALGHAWLARYGLPWTSQPQWHVIAPGGEWLGDVSTPADVTVFEIGDDYLLGRHVDENGIERVVTYALDR